MARNPSPALDRPWRRPGALRYALERVRGVAKPPITVTDPPADVVIERDVEVPTRDGTLLRINVFRSAEGGARPVIASIHPYGKDALPRRRGNRWTFSPQYRMLRQPKPLTFSALTGWEAPDPAWWTAQGFVVVNADSRGCGRSDGTGDLLSHQEAEDTYDLVGWLADQAWSDGRVVMLGVSYLAISQYAVAALQPPALRAICPWEGFTDAYRDLAFPGGIRESGFTRLWSRGVRRRTRQTYDMEQMQEAHPLRDDFWRSRVPDLSAIKVPMLVCGSFSDNNLHSRGSIRAFTRSGCGHARLYTHRGGKWETFYSATALSEQLKFLRDALAGSSGSRSVRLEVREDRDTITAVREETQWPLAGTRWRPMYLAGPGLLATEPPPTAGSIRFQTRSRAAAFNWTIPEDIELTGPMAARLWVQLDGCDDANLFVGVEKWRDGQFDLMFSVFSVSPGALGDQRDAIIDDASTFFKQQEERGVVVRGLYDVAGLRADADFMVWTHAERVEALQATYADFRRTTTLGRACTPVWSGVGLHRPAEFNKSHIPAFLAGEEPGAYICVYPFVRSYEWYLLPDEERRRMLAEHGMAARGYKDVRANTVPAFALGDYEWILAFEAPELDRIVDLMRELRATDARRHTRAETPFFTGPRVPVEQLVHSLP